MDASKWILGEPLDRLRIELAGNLAPAGEECVDRVRAWQVGHEVEALRAGVDGAVRAVWTSPPKYA